MDRVSNTDADERDTSYYDTADGDLQTFGVQLRRVDHDGDVRWQLTLSRGAEPVEVRSTADTVPSEISDVLTGLRMGKPLSNVATLRSERDHRQSDALSSYLREQIDTIFDGDVGLRRGIDPIHDTRVAIRRLRSTLRVFGKLLDQSALGDLDEELKWFAGLLGDVRDCHVQRQRFDAALAELAPELVLGPVANRIHTDLRSDEMVARARVTEAMDSRRYFDLLARLHGWRTSPPVAASTSKALNQRARKAERKADRRLAEAVKTGDDTHLHRARKAAKRARYAAELRIQIQKRAKDTVKRYKRIQSILGDHQDGVVASATLRRLAISAGTTPGENGFTYGMLYAREQHAADEARRRARALLR